MYIVVLTNLYTVGGCVTHLRKDYPKFLFKIIFSYILAIVRDLHNFNHKKLNFKTSRCTG